MGNAMAFLNSKSGSKKKRGCKRGEATDAQKEAQRKYMSRQSSDALGRLDLDDKEFIKTAMNRCKRKEEKCIYCGAMTHVHSQKIRAYCGKISCRETHKGLAYVRKIGRDESLGIKYMGELIDFTLHHRKEIIDIGLKELERQKEMREFLGKNTSKVDSYIAMIKKEKADGIRSEGDFDF